MLKCLICGSDHIQKTETVISDFVMARIAPDVENKPKKTELCFCSDCSFAFYAYRFSKMEENLLYRNYRDDEYQRTREKYECWYTKKVNAALNTGEAKRQQETIKKLLDSHLLNSFQSALDYGGNKGATFYHELGTKAKYVRSIMNNV